MAKLAKTFEVTESSKILIDGEEFPWFVSSDDPIEVVRDASGNICFVTLTVMSESARIDPARKALRKGVE